MVRISITKHWGAAIVLLIVLWSLSGCGVFINPIEGSVEPALLTTSEESTLFPPVETGQPVQEPTEPHILTPMPTSTPTGTTAVDFFHPDLPLGAAAYVIPLSVRHVTEEQAVLFFELSEAAQGRLVYQRVDTQDRVEIPIQAGQLRNQVLLEGLEPGTAYRAAVILAEDGAHATQPGFNGRVWEPVTFETASGEYPIRVGVVGDASFGDDTTSQLIERMTQYELDFVLHTGDVVYVDPGAVDPFSAYLERFYEPFATLLRRMPVYTVLGNHDYDPSIRYNGEPFYFYAFPPFQDAADPNSGSRERNQYYAFGRGQVQFLMLDSQVIFGVEGRQEQENWIGDRLADSRFRVTIPVFHVSPYSSSTVHPEDSLPVRGTWARMFEQIGAPVVFSGHFHHYERSVSGGTTFIVSGGGSSTLYALGSPLPESQFYARRSHFVLLEIHPDRLELTAIDPNGEVIDRATVTLN